jgi:hypothetical protein
MWLWSLKHPVGRHGHRPVELIAECLREDLVDRHLAALAPGHRDARVHVVDLGRAQRHLLVLVAVADVHLQLAQRVRPRDQARLDGSRVRGLFELVLILKTPLLVLRRWNGVQKHQITPHYKTWGFPLTALILARAASNSAAALSRSSSDVAFSFFFCASAREFCRPVTTSLSSALSGILSAFLESANFFQLCHREQKQTRVIREVQTHNTGDEALTR